MLLDGFVRKAEEKGIRLFAAQVISRGETLDRRHFDDEAFHNVYSAAKSVLSTGVGIALDRGLMGLGDRPADYFPEFMGPDPDPRWDRVTLRHLLTMTSGHGRSYMMEKQRRELEKTPEGRQDWLAHVFSLPMEYEPGSAFVYGNQCPYLAGRMLEKAVGADLETWLGQEVFDPLGLPRPRWEKDPFGHLIGATGLWMRVEDMAALGWLYADGGLWQGKRILSEGYIRAASSRQAPSRPISPGGGSREEEQGYGYWFWINEGEGFRAYGRESQFILVLPETGAVIALQADHHDTPETLALIRETICPLL